MSNLLQKLEDGEITPFSAFKEFKAIEAEVKAVYNELYNRLNLHDEIDKMKMFRIYRDVRFSKDKTPYKTHFGGSFHRKKPALRGGYYLHIAPNNESFIRGIPEVVHKAGQEILRHNHMMKPSLVYEKLLHNPYNFDSEMLNYSKVYNAIRGIRKKRKGELKKPYCYRSSLT